MSKLPNSRCKCRISLLLSLFGAAAMAQGQTKCVEVRDSSGAAVATAAARTPASVYKADQQGRIELPVTTTRALVSATGFRGVWLDYFPSTGCAQVTLVVAGLAEKVVVTPTRTESAESQTIESVQVLSATELRSTQAIALDDVLKQSPGFTLFRRTSSVVSNPTSQGVSLRGVGASGASRALVLNDGVPLNDAFGGWVYWSRIPSSSLETVELMSGGGSHLYGNSALGGVVALTPRQLADSYLNVELSAGNLSTQSGRFEGAIRAGKWSVGGSASGFRTNGYVLTATPQRGSIDVEATSRNGAGTLRVERSSEINRYFLSTTIFNEGRANGTPLQTNATRLVETSTGFDHQFAISVLQLRAFGTAEHYDQSFTSINTARSSEALTRGQDVPSQQLGVGAHWLQNNGVFGLGGEFREIRGLSDELAFVNGVPNRFAAAGGRQRSRAGYAQAKGNLRRTVLSLGLRLDAWQNYEAFTQTAPLASPYARTRTQLASKSELSFNPHGGALVSINENISWTASAYHAFRAPTLNELYRGFRVGNVQTNANELLKAERLTGAETSLRFNYSRFRASGTFFWSQINDPITNLTLSSTPALITRQRANLGSSRSTGFEGEFTFRANDEITLRSGYQFADSIVTSYSPDRTLEGKRLPQTPRQNVSLSGIYSRPSFTISAQLRAADSQFEDDRNLFALDPYAVVDLFASKTLTRQVAAFIAVENIGNLRYAVGASPVTQWATPTLGRVGVRIHFGK